MVLTIPPALKACGVLLCGQHCNLALKQKAACIGSTQDMMLKVGVLGYVVPLLFGFDPTHDGEAGAPSTDASAVASLAAGPEEAGGLHDAGPAYLGLGMSRSNMQASVMCEAQCAA